MQQPREEPEARQQVRTADFGGEPGHGQAVSVDGVHGKAGNAFGGMKYAETFHGKNQALQDTHAQETDGGANIRNIADHAEERRIYSCRILAHMAGSRSTISVTWAFEVFESLKASCISRKV